MKISLQNDMSHDYILKKNKRAQRALGRSPEEKIKSHSGAIYRWPLMLYTKYQDSSRFLCHRHWKNGAGALSVTPVHACVRSSVCASVHPLSKFGVCLITFERLHRLNSNLVCWYIISIHRSSSIWVTIH